MTKTLKVVGARVNQIIGHGCIIVCGKTVAKIQDQKAASACSDIVDFVFPYRSSAP